MAKMNKRSKVLLIVAITAVVIAGLIILQSYFKDKFGIFADVLTDEKVLFSRSVASNGFANDTMIGLVQDRGTLRIQGKTEQVCGIAPDSIDMTGFDSSKKFSVLLPKDHPAYIGYDVIDFDDNYYVGNDHFTDPQHDRIREHLILPSGDSISNDKPGFSITRGNGWLYLELDKRESTDPLARNHIEGTITFPEGINISGASFVNISGENGLENPSNGSNDLTHENDEVTIDAVNRRVTFNLTTQSAKDSFYINYCFSKQTDLVGSLSGQIDLGSIKPISKLRVTTDNYIVGRDTMAITAEISKDGVTWIKGREKSSNQYLFQGIPPRDSYCFRYIKYNIKLTSNSSLASSPYGLKEVNVYGGDVCGTENPFDPSAFKDKNTACSNKIDDDKDGKIDYPGDVGCTSYMDDLETDALKICQDNSHEDINLKVNMTQHVDAYGNNMKKDIYVGASTNPVANNSEIPLVYDGVAIKDNGFRDKVTGLSIYRGEGYFFLFNRSEGIEVEGMSMDFEIMGSTIKKVIDYENEGGADGAVQIGDENKDEYSITIGKNSGKYTTTTVGGKDGVYVFYDYVPKIAGGCQCQDGIDNDKNGTIDYPNDTGCLSLLDNEEKTSEQVDEYPVCKNGFDDDNDGLIDYPEDPGCISAEDDNEQDPAQATQILPAVINSGVGFFVLLGVIIMIAIGLIIYVVRKD